MRAVYLIERPPCPVRRTTLSGAALTSHLTALSRLLRRFRAKNAAISEEKKKKAAEREEQKTQAEKEAADKQAKQAEINKKREENVAIPRYMPRLVCRMPGRLCPAHLLAM